MIYRLAKAILSILRQQRLRLFGVQISSPRLLASCIDCRPGISAAGRGRIEIGAAAWIEQGVVLHAHGGHIQLGRDVFLGPYAVIYGHGGVSVGEGTLIAMHCRILSSSHTVAPLGTDIRSQPDIPLPTKIGRDVWLGAGATVLGGVTIGDGCVIGAGAVVTRDLPCGSVALGVPAHIIRKRE